MRVLFLVAVFSAVLALPSSVFAAGPARQQNPYASLFTAQLSGVPAPSVQAPVPAPPLVPLTMRQSADNQTIICGMTIVEGDAKVDTAMPHHPSTSGPKPLIRTVQPQICHR
jgi:hypothetical protein